MNATLRRVHALAAWAFVIAIASAAFLAGSSIAQLGGSNSFLAHIELGYTVGIVAALVVLPALVARVGRRAVLITLVLLAIYVVQTILPLARGAIPVFAALHPVNALVLFALAAWYARMAWRDLPSTTATDPARAARGG